MAAVANSGLLACNYAHSAAADRLSVKLRSSPPPPPAASSASATTTRIHCSGAVRGRNASGGGDGRRSALLSLAGVLFAAGASAVSSSNAGVIDEYLEKSKANKELNDKKRLATSGANFARAYTVQFGTCKFPENFTGYQDLAKQKKVPFISEDLELECAGKDKYKCGSNVFWKW